MADGFAKMELYFLTIIDDMKTKYFVRRESRDGLCLPEIKAWDSCHSLIYSPDGDINACDAQWVGFFVDKKTAKKVKSILEKEL